MLLKKHGKIRMSAAVVLAVCLICCAVPLEAFADGGRFPEPSGCRVTEREKEECGQGLKGEAGEEMNGAADSLEEETEAQEESEAEDSEAKSDEESQAETEGESYGETEEGYDDVTEEDSEEATAEETTGQEAQTLPETYDESTGETESGTESETEPEAEPETETESETEPGTEAEAETEPETEPEIESESEMEPETEPETEPEIEAEPETEPETESETEPETEPVPETEPETTAETEAESAAESETEAEAGTKPETERGVGPEEEEEEQTTPALEPAIYFEKDTVIFIVGTAKTVCDQTVAITGGADADNAGAEAVSYSMDTVSGLSIDESTGAVSVSSIEDLVYALMDTSSGMITFKVYAAMGGLEAEYSVSIGFEDSSGNAFSVSDPSGNNGWYTEAAVVTALSPYEISAEPGGDYSQQITIKEQGHSALYIYIKNKETGALLRPELIDVKIDSVICAAEFTVNGEAASGMAGAYSGSIVVTFEYADANPVDVQVRLEQTLFDCTEDVTEEYVETAQGTYGGSAVIIIPETRAADGIYRLTVTVTDEAGNTSRSTLMFTANRYGSLYEYSDYLAYIIEDGGRYLKTLSGQASAVTSDLVITEYSACSVSQASVILLITRDGEPIDAEYEVTGTDHASDGSGWYEYTYTIAKENFEQDGTYKITLISIYETADGGENTSHSGPSNSTAANGAQILDSMTFTVDTTAPEIRGITDTDDNEISGAVLVLGYTIIDAGGIASVEIYIDNEPQSVPVYSLGTAYLSGTLTLYRSSGAQTVRIVVTDLAGNTAEAYASYASYSVIDQIVKVILGTGGSDADDAEASYGPEAEETDSTEASAELTDAQTSAWGRGKAPAATAAAIGVSAGAAACGIYRFKRKRK